MYNLVLLKMELNENYLMLLTEHGIPLSNEEVKNFKIIERPITKCCNLGDMEVLQRDEGYYCVRCGKVSTEKVLACPPLYNKGGPLGSESTMVWTRKRFYKPITHFREHLRRYMGARFTELNKVRSRTYGSFKQIVSSLEFDPHSCKAYYLVKSLLKEKRLSFLYKEIFCIIYIKGGKNPSVGHELFEKCVLDFKALAYHFTRKRHLWKRHSMPSMYMIMEYLLRENGHTPFYEMPSLKDDILSRRVKTIYTSLQTIRNIHNANAS